MQQTDILFQGDSLTGGTADGVASVLLGGIGTWVEQFIARLMCCTDLGPLLSPGLQPIYQGIAPYGSTRWTRAGSWTQCADTDAFDKAPVGLGWFASTASDIVTFTVPTFWQSLVGFDLDFIDLTGGDNGSYRLTQSGVVGSWTGWGQVNLDQSNAYRRFYVTAALKPGDKIEIRCANAAGTGKLCLPVGVRPWHLAPSTAQGLIYTVLAAGGTTLRQAVLATSGDRLACVDDVVAGTGSPYVGTPDVSLMMHINDNTIINNPTTWGTDEDIWEARMSPHGTVAFMSPWEVDTDLATTAEQDAYRDVTKANAAGYSPVCPVLDMFDEWVKDGYNTNAKLVTAGYVVDLLGNTVHEGPKGHNSIAHKVFGFMANEVMDFEVQPMRYPVKSATPAYAMHPSIPAFPYGSGLAVRPG